MRILNLPPQCVLLIDSVTTDTCQAFTEYLQTPSNTTLDELLPCVDPATAASTSNMIKQGVNNIVLQVC